MATYSKPAKIPRWNDNLSNNVEPPEGKKDIGWVFEEIHPSTFENWLMNLNGQWLKWIDERLDDGATNDVLETQMPLGIDGSTNFILEDVGGDARMNFTGIGGDDYINYDTSEDRLEFVWGGTRYLRFDSNATTYGPIFDENLYVANNLWVGDGLNVGLLGTVVDNTIKVGDDNLRLGLDGTSRPRLTFDFANDSYIRFERLFDYYQFFSLGVEEARLGPNGLAVKNGIYVGDETGTPTDNDIYAEGDIEAGNDIDAGGDITTLTGDVTGYTFTNHDGSFAVDFVGGVDADSYIIAGTSYGIGTTGGGELQFVRTGGASASSQVGSGQFPYGIVVGADITLQQYAVTIRDDNFYLYNDGTDPFIYFDDKDYITYDRSASTKGEFKWYIDDLMIWKMYDGGANIPFLVSQGDGVIYIGTGGTLTTGNLAVHTQMDCQGTASIVGVDNLYPTGDNAGQLGQDLTHRWDSVYTDRMRYNADSAMRLSTGSGNSILNLPDGTGFQISGDDDADYVCVIGNDDTGTAGNVMDWTGGPNSSSANYTFVVAKVNTSLTVTGEIKTVSGVFQVVDVSDSRLKDVVGQTKVDCLDIVNRLKLIEHQFKPVKAERLFRKGKKIERPVHRVAFDALNCREVYPEMVTEMSDKLPDGSPVLGTARGQLIPVLVRAVQQLTERLEALEGAR